LSENLLPELHKAIEIRRQHRTDLSEAQERLSKVRAELRACPQYKALKAVKATIKTKWRDYVRAQDGVEAVEAELLHGLTGLPLMDAGKPALELPPAAGINGPPRRKRGKTPAAMVLL
jgi:hypothetical protein